jgi:YqaJ-like recombinase protein
VSRPRAKKPGPILHKTLVQGSEEWHAARCGLLTASEMKLILTPSLKTASNAAERAHVYELAAQRITRYVEPHYVGDEMLRGHDEEIDAKIAYAEHYAKVTDVGFITNDKWGFTIGCSPDGLVGRDGMLECKSRRQKFQVETIASGEMPDDFSLQVQTLLLVSERKWCDFVSYSGGLPMVTIRVFPNAEIQAAIIAAATAFEARVCERVAEYRARLKTKARLIPTERKVVQEMYV